MLRFHSLRVAEIHPDAEDAVGISLEVPTELCDTYRGLAGQHVVLRTEINDEETRRTYSLVNAPGEWPLRIVARVHPAGYMSRYLAEQLNAGDHVDILPPNGSFTPRRAGKDAGTYVAFASGCGITPVLSVAQSLLKGNVGNRVILFYGNAVTARAMCLEELLALKDRYLDRLSLHFVMSREPQEVELYNGRIDPARVRQFAKSLFVPADVAEYFVCGPGNMIDEVSATLRELGVEPDRVHGEHFTVATTAAVAGVPAADAAVASPAVIEVEFASSPSDGAAQSLPRSADRSPPGAAGTPRAQSADDALRPGGAADEATVPSTAQPAARRTEQQAPRAVDKPPVPADSAEVAILMDGRRRSFVMRMNDESVLDAAARAGLELPFSCRAGVCSTCRTKVVRGEVEMAQNYALEEWEVEQGYVLACQSRVTTPVLELDYDEK
jgi:ring-1,2-phenylacetyl-CoA epoxidase subunit PaaE